MKDSIKDLYSEIMEEIFNFRHGKINFLNIISLPYNETYIFKDLVIDLIASKKKVLYITNEDYPQINFFQVIKNHNNLIKCAYFDSNSDNDDLQSELVFTNHKNAMKIGRVFDFIIYDDLSSYSFYNKFEILGLLSRCAKDTNTKIIVYSYTKIFNIENDIILPAYKSALPMVEPRIMVTRVNTNKEIPNCAFEHLEYSIMMKRRVVIFIPEMEILLNTYRYLNSISDQLTDNIYILEREDEKEKLLKKFKKERNILILTSEFEEELYCEDGEVDYLVVFNDNLYHNKKKLLFICGRASNVEMDKRGEVIFLTNEIDNDIDIIKSVTRKFNERAWEMGLLKI